MKKKKMEDPRTQQHRDKPKEGGLRRKLSPHPRGMKKRGGRGREKRNFILRQMALEFFDEVQRVGRGGGGVGKQGQIEGHKFRKKEKGEKEKSSLVFNNHPECGKGGHGGIGGGRPEKRKRAAIAEKTEWGGGGNFWVRDHPRN